MHARHRHGWPTRRAKAVLHHIELFEARRLLAAYVVGSPTIYATIQAAVNAAPAGGTVTVDAGTYSEMVTINQTLTLSGAQAGVDGRSTNRGVGESILTGIAESDGVSGALVINANDVTVDGFTIQGNTSAQHIGAGLMITPDVAGTHLVNNIIQNNIAGMILANSSPTDAAIIQHNLFQNNNQPGVQGDFTGRGIYANGDLTDGYLTNVVIDSNAFLNNYGGLVTNSRESAIGLEAAGSDDVQSNITITNNAFDFDGKVLLAYDASGLLIQNNVMTATRDTRSGTLRFEGNVNNVQILGNTIYDNTARGIRIDNNAVQGDNYGFTINNNNIYHNATDTTQGVNHDGLYVDPGTYDGTLDASNNYWGSASGPSGDGPGKGDAVYANGNDIDFTPWAAAPVTSADIAYFDRPFQPGERIDAIDYNQGGEGVAYHDIETINQGHVGRLNEGVDMQPSSDPGSGYNLAWVRAGEWLDYTIAATNAGNYDFSFRVASAQTVGGNFHLIIDGVAVTGEITVPGTGDLQKYVTITKTSVPLTAGQHIVRLAFDSGGAGLSVGNFNWFKFTASNTQSPPPPPTSPPTSPPPTSPPTSPPPTSPPTSPPATGTAVQYIAAGSVWKYLDNGSNQGTAWETNTFADASWKSGAAQLGYGDGDEATVVSYGSNANQKYTTTYFRDSFNVTDPTQVTALNLGLIRDDGAVVYLNGTEIYRNNMPTGTITSSTFASTNVDGADESAWYASTINPALLVAGKNTIAVEVHQSVPDSSDISFDFQLNATVNVVTPPPPPTSPPVSPPPPPPPPTSPPPPPPSAWTDGDIGATGAAGNVSLLGSSYTVKGSGADIYGNADAFNYDYQQMTGDGQIVVRVASTAKGADLLAKAGIDIRSSLSAGATHAGVYITPANGVKFIRRSSTNGASTSTTSTVSGAATPIWLKLVRSGNTISSYRSANGTTWTLIGSQTLTLGQTVYVGLAVCSHQAATAVGVTFDNVTIGAIQ